MMENEGTKKDVIASVVKAVRILNCFDLMHKELSLAEITKLTGYPKTTTFGFVNTLLKENLLARSAKSDTYTLGARLMELAYFTKASLPIIQIATPAMNRLNAQSGQNVYLTTHMLGRVLFLESYYRDREYIGYSEAGKTLPMHCTASGKAMLSYMTPEQVELILDTHPLKPSGRNTITDRDELKAELKRTRERGYAIDNEEEDLGVKCVAVPVLNQQGEPVGAISLSGSATLMPDEKMPEFYQMMSAQLTILRLNAGLFPYQYLPPKE